MKGVNFTGVGMALGVWYHGALVLLVGVLTSVVISKGVCFLSLQVVRIKEFRGFRNVESGRIEDIGQTTLFF